MDARKLGSSGPSELRPSPINRRVHEKESIIVPCEFESHFNSDAAYENSGKGSQADLVNSKLQCSVIFGTLSRSENDNATFYVPTNRLLTPDIKLQILGIPTGFPPLPIEVVKLLQTTGKKAPTEKIKLLIAHLCAIGPLKLPELAAILQRKPDHLRKRYLSKMIQNQELEYLFPESSNHPQQAYKAKKT